MNDSLLDRAIQDPDTPEHRALFRAHWLPMVLGDEAVKAYDGVADSFLVSLHPNIYRYGPHYEQLVKSLARIRHFLDSEQEEPLWQLFGLSQNYNNFFNFHPDDYQDNPDYAYRTCVQQEYMLQVPNYGACFNHPFLKDWAAGIIDENGYKAINDHHDLILNYNDTLLAWDVLKDIPSFGGCRSAFEEFQHDQQMPGI